MSAVLQKCPSCGLVKTAADFNRGPRKNGLSAYCKACCNVKHVCKTYNITQQAYQALIEDSQGRCKCCGEEPTRLVVDHDHNTGRVRGLICDPCNHYIGMLESRPGIHKYASEFLGLPE